MSIFLLDNIIILETSPHYSTNGDGDGGVVGDGGSDGQISDNDCGGVGDHVDDGGCVSDGSSVGDTGVVADGGGVSDGSSVGDTGVVVDGVVWVR